MQKKRITVIGHYGMSLIFDVKRFPVAGETVEALEANMEGGGKGYNQAVGAARLGAHVNFITAVGDDDFGKSCEKSLRTERVDGIHVTRIPGKMTACGVAMNSLDKRSEVVVFPGAIRSLNGEAIRRYSSQITESDVLLVQNEISVEALTKAVRIAWDAGVRIVYNPAPARAVPPALFEMMECITPNETEAAVLTGADPEQPLDLDRTVEHFHRMGVRNVVVTLGANGAILSQDGGKRTIIEPFAAKVVSTTGAGDSFNAALAVRLAEGADYLEAVRFATAAASIAVAREGITKCMPYRDEVDALVGGTTERCALAGVNA